MRFDSLRLDRCPPHRGSADGTTTTGCWPGAAASSSCGSRTPTRERSTPENVEQIFEGAALARPRLGRRPVFQSEQDRHAEVVEQLIAGGHAYRSTAGPTRSRPSRRRTATPASRRGRGGAVRLRMPDEGAAVVRDVIRGEHVREPADGRPRDRARRRHAVYHLAVVVDDLDAGITRVVRGADHYSNTPKQMRILEAMGAESRSTPTSRCCTGPTARSSPSATAPPPCRSCATPATCARPSGTTSPCSAGASTPDTTSTTRSRSSSSASLRARLQEPGRVRREEAAP